MRVPVIAATQTHSTSLAARTERAQESGSNLRSRPPGGEPRTEFLDFIRVLGGEVGFFRRIFAEVIELSSLAGDRSAMVQKQFPIPCHDIAGLHTEGRPGDIEDVMSIGGSEDGVALDKGLTVSQVDPLHRGGNGQAAGLQDGRSQID